MTFVTIELRAEGRPSGVSHANTGSRSNSSRNDKKKYASLPHKNYGTQPPTSSLRVVGSGGDKGTHQVDLRPSQWEGRVPVVFCSCVENRDGCLTMVSLLLEKFKRWNSPRDTDNCSFSCFNSAVLRAPTHESGVVTLKILARWYFRRHSKRLSSTST